MRGFEGLRHLLEAKQKEVEALKMAYQGLSIAITELLRDQASLQRELRDAQEVANTTARARLRDVVLVLVSYPTDTVTALAVLERAFHDQAFLCKVRELTTRPGKPPEVPGTQDALADAFLERFRTRNQGTLTRRRRVPVAATGETTP